MRIMLVVDVSAAAAPVLVLPAGVPACNPRCCVRLATGLGTVLQSAACCGRSAGKGLQGSSADGRPTTNLHRTVLVQASL